MPPRLRRRRRKKGRKTDLRQGSTPRGKRRGRRQQELAVAGCGDHRAVRFAAEEPRAHRVHRVRTHHQGDLPGFRKVALVDLHILCGEKYPAARMRMVPAHRCKALFAQVLAAFVEQSSEAGIVLRGKRETGTERVLALDRTVRQDANTAGVLCSDSTPPISAPPCRSEK